MSKKVRLSFVLICFCISIVAASKIAYCVEGVSLSGLPAVVQEVVKREFAGARVTEIDDDDYDGIDVYEIEAETADGKELMIKVGPDGTLYQKEIEIGLGDVPKAVLDTFRKELGNADNDVDEVKRISKQGRVQYNIEAEISGKDIELKIAADGTLLEKDVDDDDDDEGDDEEEQIEISSKDFNLSPSPKVVSGLGKIDLSKAKIVALNKQSKIQASAADMLADEIERRTRIGLEVVKKMPDKGMVTIVIGTGKEVRRKVGGPPSGLAIPKKADGYAIWIDRSEKNAAMICLAGVDDRGALYAVGRLLRMMEMGRDKVSVDAGIKVATAPKYALRGHQMGYRAKTNSYDAWTVEMWEQYYRDMIVFGMNAVEIVPPITDDLPDSPVMPKKPMDMMIAQSKLADDYGLEVWIWYPAMEFRDKKREKISPELMELAIRNRDDVLSKLPRIDAVFVPSGDPGEVRPRYLFPHMKEQKKVLNKYHPKAQIWSSVQNYDDESATMGWIKEFYGWLNSDKVDWFDGVVFGPATEISLREMRQDVPERFPIRRYPDITHSRSCQYEVGNWDNALESTLGREPINPRPRAYAKIFRKIQQYSI
ncbi:MAG: PepSY-like domain-containing protein, partial [Planctomycetota bacterium]